MGLVWSEQWDDNGCMSDTVLLAFITAAAAICTAAIGAHDRRLMYQLQQEKTAEVADELLKSGVTAV